ncbi:MAG: iron ABC transporter permease [Cellvibrionales bacterium]|nr:iron ABC transporter permease [Cellvibrionales bacterium]|tara:strand:+ start:2627 stop:3682 length:1056 start_codon:yes stop_codon:yes gene_type:complete
MPTLLLLMTPLVLFLGLCVGPVAITPPQVLSQLPYLLSSQSPAEPNLMSSYAIVRELRLPRTFLAWLVGSGLALSGAAMQGLFRNPLADPSIIGVTSGASLGASVAVVIIGPQIDVWLGLSGLVVGAFIGGLLAVLIVYRLASETPLSAKTGSLLSGQGNSVATMLLVGIAITALAGAANSALAFVADNETLRRISLWNMGGLDGANDQRLIFGVFIILPAMFIVWRSHRSLDALLLGESEAHYLGVNVSHLKRLLIVMVALAVATSVALAGVIGFVGLVVPHLLRMVVGPSHRQLMLCSALAGGILLVLADVLARSLVSPAELPVGVVTAVLGAPFFIFLLRQRRGHGLQ